MYVTGQKTSKSNCQQKTKDTANKLRPRSYGHGEEASASVRYLLVYVLLQMLHLYEILHFIIIYHFLRK